MVDKMVRQVGVGNYIERIVILNIQKHKSFQTVTEMFLDNKVEILKTFTRRF